MAAIGASGYLTAGLSLFSQWRATSYGGMQKRPRILAVSTERIERGTSFGGNGSFEKKKMVKEETEVKPNIYANPEELPEVEEGKKRLKDYFEECKEMIRSDGGPPRWFSPLDCSSSSPDCPLLLFLPGSILFFFLIRTSLLHIQFNAFKFSII